MSSGIEPTIEETNLVFAPTSAPTSWLFDTGNTTWKEWNPKNLERSLGRLERTVRAFGGGAKDVWIVRYSSFYIAKTYPFSSLLYLFQSYKEDGSIIISCNIPMTRYTISMEIIIPRLFWNLFLLKESQWPICI